MSEPKEKIMARVILQQDAVLTQNIQELFTPGVIVEVSADEADEWGAFNESALTEEQAWEANPDLGGESHE